MTDKLLEALRATLPPEPPPPSYEDYERFHAPEPPKPFTKPFVAYQGCGAVPSRARYLAYLAEEIAGTNLKLEDVASVSRKKKHTRPRFRAWRRLRADGFSLPGIGKIAQRDHSSILSGLRRLKSLEQSQTQEGINEHA